MTGTENVAINNTPQVCINSETLIPITDNLPAEDRIDFYNKLKGRDFRLHHPFLKALRMEQPKSLFSYYGLIKRDLSLASANYFLGQYLGQYLTDNPLGWTNLDTYLTAGDFLRQACDGSLRSLGIKMQVAARQFIQDQKERQPELYKSLSDDINQPEKWHHKVVRTLIDGGPGRLLEKAIKEMGDLVLPNGEEGVREAYKSAPIGLKALTGTLPGFEIQNVLLNNKKVAVLITGDPNRGARVGIDIHQGGGVTIEKVEGQLGGRLQYQGPGSFQHGEKRAPELAILNGMLAGAKLPDAERHDAYILISSDGKLHIADKRNIRLSEITGRNNDRSVVMRLRIEPGKSATGMDLGGSLDLFTQEMAAAKASMVAAILISKEGRNEWIKENGADQRRLLLEFNNDTFGVISTICGQSDCIEGGGETMGINDLLALSIRISEQKGGLKSAAYLDTGMYDWTSYYTYEAGQRTRRVVGYPDRNQLTGKPETNQMCRIYFYQSNE